MTAILIRINVTCNSKYISSSGSNVNRKGRNGKTNRHEHGSSQDSLRSVSDDDDDDEKEMSRCDMYMCNLRRI